MQPQYGGMQHRGLQVLQNKCLKIIFGKPTRYPTATLHQRANMPLIDDLITQMNNNFMSNTVSGFGYSLQSPSTNGTRHTKSLGCADRCAQSDKTPITGQVVNETPNIADHSIRSCVSNVHYISEQSKFGEEMSGNKSVPQLSNAAMFWHLAKMIEDERALRVQH